MLKVLWTSAEPQFLGEFVSFADIVFEPKPIQKPHPPIWIGGSSMAALRRAARVGSGWHPSGSQGGTGPWLNSIADLPTFLDEARRVPGFVERESAFDIAMPVTSSRFGPNHERLTSVDEAPRSAQEIVDRVVAMESAGVTWTSIPALDARPPSISGTLSRGFGSGGFGGYGCISVIDGWRWHTSVHDDRSHSGYAFPMRCSTRSERSSASSSNGYAVFPYSAAANGSRILAALKGRMPKMMVGEMSGPSLVYCGARGTVATSLTTRVLRSCR